MPLTEIERSLFRKCEYPDPLEDKLRDIFTRIQFCRDFEGRYSHDVLPLIPKIVELLRETICRMQSL